MNTGVEVFGQLELVERLKANEQHYDHLISIGNPKRLFRPPQPDEAIPSLFKEHFKRILRLEFTMLRRNDTSGPGIFPKEYPRFQMCGK